jgi:hypothetical protein
MRATPTSINMRDQRKSVAKPTPVRIMPNINNLHPTKNQMRKNMLKPIGQPLRRMLQMTAAIVFFAIQLLHQI